MMKIRINGREYPARLTMGVLLLFKRETGHDVSEMNAGDMEEALRLLWCCIRCASQADGVDFPLDFETFCNSISPAEVTRWFSSMEEEQKKKQPAELNPPTPPQRT